MIKLIRNYHLPGENLQIWFGNRKRTGTSFGGRPNANQRFALLVQQCVHHSVPPAFHPWHEKRMMHILC